MMPLPLTYADGVALRERLEFVLEKTFEMAVAWRAPAPAASPLAHVPRYAPEAINAELAMILYRMAVRLGLHATGTEALLLRALQQAEEELAKFDAGTSRHALGAVVVAAGMSK